MCRLMELRCLTMRQRLTIFSVVLKSNDQQIVLSCSLAISAIKNEEEKQRTGIGGRLQRRKSNTVDKDTYAA